MKAIIPAAGIGTRLRPHTHTAPKALLHVAGKPILGHILDELRAFGISDVVFVVGFLGEKIVEYVNKNYRIKATFVEQQELKGLGWAIYLTREFLNEEPVLIILGDTIFETDLGSVIKGQYDSIGTKVVSDPRRFGVAVTEGKFITSLVEKPESPVSNQAIVGIYYIKSTGLFKKSLEELIDRGITTKGEYQLTDALGLMVKHGCQMTTFPVDGWYDCGKPETLLSTNRQLLDKLDQQKAPNGTVIIPPVFIAPDATIERSVIGPYATVADGAIVEDSIIRNSILSNGARVYSSLLEESIIGNNAQVKGNFNKMNVGNSSEINYK